MADPYRGGLPIASNEYHFLTRWLVQGDAVEVSAIIADATSLPRWWPAVYLEVAQLEPGDEKGLGKVVSLYTKGWLPYTLRWQFRVTESDPPHGFTLEAWGDFIGRGIWAFRQAGEWVEVTYDWKIRADKPLLRRLSWLLKPVFSLNHHWAMATGERSLRLELERRHAPTVQEWAAVPAPPGPTTSSPLPLLIVAALAIYLGAKAIAGRRGSRERLPAG